MTPFAVWLDRISGVTTTTAVWGLFLSGAVIYFIAEWRLRVLALFAQYLFIGVLFTRVFVDRPEMSLLKVLVGWLVCGALFLSARIRQTAGEKPHFHWAADLPFRALSLVMMTVVAYLASQRYTLPFVPQDLALGCILLAVFALLFIGAEEDAGVVGVGVLNLLAALDLFYSAQDPGLVVTGMLIMVNLLVGLAISYLTVAEVRT
ncbi:MAG TPA: hypothetical protein PLJ24_12620 [Anaerolineae bacterium]|nr:hypothetical protein [Anaerolineae bacterium]